MACRREIDYDNYYKNADFENWRNDRIEHHREKYLKSTGVHYNLSSPSLHLPRIEYERLVYMSPHTVGFHDIERFKNKNLGGGGVRKAIIEFSRKSSLNLLNTFYSLDFGKKYLYSLTLTYGKRLPQNSREVKRHIKAFREWMRRHGYQSYLWKLEYQMRGAPHFHFIIFHDWPLVLGNYYNIFGKPHVRNKLSKYGKGKYLDRWNGNSACRHEMQKAWNRIADPKSEDHFLASVELDKVRSPDSMGFYMINYVAGEKKANKKKQNQVPEKYIEGHGRFWGYTGIEKMKAGKVFITADDKMLEESYRIINLYIKRKGVNVKIIPAKGSVIIYDNNIKKSLFRHLRKTCQT